MRSIQDVLEGSKRNLRTMVGSHEQGEAIAKFMEELDDVLVRTTRILAVLVRLMNSLGRL